MNLSPRTDLLSRMKKTEPMTIAEQHKFLERAIRSGDLYCIDMIFKKLYPKNPVLLAEELGHWHRVEDARLPVSFYSEEARTGSLVALKTAPESLRQSVPELFELDLVSVERDAVLIDAFIEYGTKAMNEMLIQSAAVGNFQLVLYLVKKGANINHTGGYDIDGEYTANNVLSFALGNPEACDPKCLLDLVNAGAKLDVHHHQNALLVRALFDTPTTDVIKLFISKRVGIPDLWANILKFQKFGLLADALDAGYDLELETRKTIIHQLWKLQMFDKVGMFLKVPKEELRSILSFTLYEIEPIYEANQIEDPELREQLKNLEHLVVRIIMTLEN